MKFFINNHHLLLIDKTQVKQYDPLFKGFYAVNKILETFEDDIEFLIRDRNYTLILEME